MSAHLLVVDDEAAIRDLLVTSLQAAGHDVSQAADIHEAKLCLADKRPDLILLDWMLPGVSGVEWARRLKADSDTADIPVIMLTARSEEDSKVHGLESGADDYVTKPFSVRELKSRIKAVLRRQQPHLVEETLTCGALQLDPVSRRVSINDEAIKIGPTEYRLLAFFMSHPERVYSRDQLLDRVWGGDVYLDDRTVDVHVLRLRKLLKPHGLNTLIETVRGSGYRFAGGA